MWAAWYERQGNPQESCRSINSSDPNLAWARCASAFTPRVSTHRIPTPVLVALGRPGAIAARGLRSPAASRTSTVAAALASRAGARTVARRASPSAMAAGRPTAATGRRHRMAVAEGATRRVAVARRGRCSRRPARAADSRPRCPFQPSGDKPVYCSACFEQRRAGGGDRGGRYGGRGR